MLHRDVAIVFHSHCLSPFRFLADMLSRGAQPHLWNAGLAFPLERLHHLIIKGIWSDPGSEKIWNEAYREVPYQLWIENPGLMPNTELSLPDIDMVCPWCKQIGTFPLVKFARMHVKKVATCECPSCSHQFNADSLSAHNLKVDLERFATTDAGWYLHWLTF
jgi:hypothetical protein